MLYQLSYDPSRAPQRTASARVLGVHRVSAGPLTANEVRVYVLRGRASNRMRPSERCPYGFGYRSPEDHQATRRFRKGVLAAPLYRAVDGTRAPGPFQ